MLKMKTWMIFLFCLSFLIRCDTEVQPLTTTELHLLMITGSWTLQKLTINERDSTSAFPDMHVYFTSDRMITSQAPVELPQNSSWRFTDDQAMTLIADRDVPLYIQLITDSTLIFQMQQKVAYKLVEGGRKKTSVNTVYSLVKEYSK